MLHPENFQQKVERTKQILRFSQMKAEPNPELENSSFIEFRLFAIMTFIRKFLSNCDSEVLIFRHGASRQFCFFVHALKTATIPMDGLWNSNEAHSLAIEGLVLLKGREAVEILCRALKHPHPSAQAKALLALVEIGNPLSILHIIPLLSDDHFVFIVPPKPEILSVSDYKVFGSSRRMKSAKKKNRAAPTTNFFEQL